jgi:ankyrin repeat protein
VYCQVVYICGCIPARIQHALADLPETLDETYQRTLREINKADWEFAHRLFQFVAVASRPLRVEELAELLAFDFNNGPILKFYEDWRLEDPVDAVLSVCSSLLAIVDGGHRFGKVIQFSHFSVKEFLTSARLAETSDIIPRGYHVSMTPAHTLAAQACLGILLHLDKDVTNDSVENLPLAKYAAEHWADHALFEGVLQNVEDGLKELFDPRKPYLAVCVWIHDPWKWNQQAERPSPHLETSLHYAALWGLHLIVEFLVKERSQNVCSRGFADNLTPLHLASKHGHVKSARILIECGADVTAENEDGETPLYLASQEGHVEIARMLIEHGASVMAQNEDGNTPLHLASFLGRMEIARMLIEHGADVMAQAEDGEIPLHLASSWGKLEVACMLVEHGADLAARNEVGRTPLHVASYWGKVEVACMLIEHGADVTVQDKEGETPLHLASTRGHIEVARVLIERGADVTAQNKDGNTALHLMLTPSHWTESQKCAEVARMLLEHGADVNAQNKSGLTPFLQASQHGFVDVTCVLLQHGADPSMVVPTIT